MNQRHTSEREGNIAVLRGLLCFSERYGTSLRTDDSCPAKGMLSVYQNALRDAISCMERAESNDFLQKLLEENRQKGFPGDTEALVQWCRERVGEDYARKFCAAFGITEVGE